MKTSKTKNSKNGTKNSNICSSVSQIKKMATHQLDEPKKSTIHRRLVYKKRIYQTHTLYQHIICSAGGEQPNSGVDTSYASLICAVPLPPSPFALLLAPLSILIPLSLRHGTGNAASSSFPAGLSFLRRSNGMHVKSCTPKSGQSSDSRFFS